jgi:hypothetical protein
MFPQDHLAIAATLGRNILAFVEFINGSVTLCATVAVALSHFSQF